MALDRNQLTIRPLDDADIPRLTKLLHAAYAEHGAAGLNFTAVDQTDEVTRARTANHQCWVADYQGDLVGTVTLSMPPSTALQALTPEAQVPGRAWLNQFAVSPQTRGSGLGRLLWDRVKEWAIKHNYASIGVDTALPAHDIIALYERWGFRRVDTIHWEGKTYDSVVMVYPDLKAH